jgi:CRP-like cAMP-binding protein
MSIPSLRTAKSNRILGALPRAALERIIPDLELKTLEMRQVVQPRRQRLKEVIFPVVGVASMISMGDSGASVEVATIGCEGMVGLPLFLGGESAAVEVFIQVPGEGMYLPAAAFRGHIEREPSLKRSLLLYTQALLTQVAQCSACNCHHPIVERCARWLLQTHDRVRGDEFPLTHDFLGLMLGIRRASVSETAQVLQERELIRYHRGVITVLDRDGLEEASCECYQLITGEFDRLLVTASRRSASM